MRLVGLGLAAGWAGLAAAAGLLAGLGARAGIGWARSRGSGRARPPPFPVSPEVGDGSQANYPAVGFAFETAVLRDAPLAVLHACKQPVSSGTGDDLPLVRDAAEVQPDQNPVLVEVLAGWRNKYPDVTVHYSSLRCGPREALSEASRQAQLVVVGARGRGGFSGLLLGSVSQAILHHSACPVEIVPHHPELITGRSTQAISEG